MVQLPFEEPTSGSTITGTSGTPWTSTTFQYLASLGLTGVELNMSWDLVEPEQNQFDLSLLRAYAQDAAQAGMVLIPIFWESVWPGNNPSWLDAPPELTSTGATAAEPAFWSATAYNAYAAYVTTVVRDLSGLPGYGGAYIDYGWLDAMWGPPPAGGGIAGYAQVDIEAWQNWLAARYHTIGQLNRVLGSSYSSFSAVPAFTPGQADFYLYEQFRIASYPILMSHLLAQVRHVTSKPLFIYFGGDMDDAAVLGNMPDQLFSLAKEFGAYVTLDDADHTPLADLFGYLSQAYGVPLLNEWTPGPGTPTEVAWWLGHYTLEGTYRLGEDYFIYEGSGHEPSFFDGTFSLYLSLHSSVAQVSGSLPTSSVGIMVGYDQVSQGLQTEGIPAGETPLAEYLDTVRPGAEVFTDQAVLDGAVRLSSFKEIVDWSDDLTTTGLSPALVQALARYQAQGGKIVEAPIQNGAPTPPSGSVPSAFDVSPASAQIETWSAVGTNGTWVTVANGEDELPGVTLGGSTPYQGTVTVLPPAGVGRSTPLSVNLAAAGLLEEKLPSGQP